MISFSCLFKSLKQVSPLHFFLKSNFLFPPPKKTCSFQKHLAGFFPKRHTCCFLCVKIYDVLFEHYDAAVYNNAVFSIKTHVCLTCLFKNKLFVLMNTRFHLVFCSRALSKWAPCSFSLASYSNTLQYCSVQRYAINWGNYNSFANVVIIPQSA